MAKMLPIYNPEYIAAFDCDDTLVRCEGLSLVSHKKHIEAIKQHWARGHHILVWSAGGAKWAQSVVDMLDISEYVHEVKSKPRWYVDDKPADEWMDRYFIPEEGFNGYVTRSNEEVTRDTQISPVLPTITFGGGSVVYPILEKQSAGFDIAIQAIEGGSGAV